MKRGIALAALALMLLVAHPAGANPRGFVPAKGAEHSRLHFDARVGPLLYNGGPVLKAHSVYLLYWQPPGSQYGANSTQTSHFKATLEQYVSDVARDSGGLANVFAEGARYSDSSGPGVYSSAFGGSARDSTPYPPTDPGCVDGTLSSCLTDAQIQSELTSQIAAHGWGGSAPNTHLYFVLLPSGVGSCINGSAGPCAYVPPAGYCGYHSDYGTQGNETIYAVMPYLGVPQCDNFERPNGRGSAADAELDVLSHEWVESITDPLGSLCTSTVSCSADAAPGWLDSAGAEIGDKCVSNSQPYFGPDSAAGTPIGGIPPPNPPASPGTLFNQQIGVPTHTYYTQREYSNAVGACVQRVVPVSFRAQSSNLTASFDGSASGAAEDPVASYVWDFGDSSAPGTGPAPRHTYAAAGSFQVQLTVTDARGNANAATQSVATANPPAAVPQPAPQPAPQPSPQAASRTGPVARISSAALAALLTKTSFQLSAASSPLSFGLATCPPVCSLTARLMARIRTQGRLRTVLAGSAKLSLTSGRQGPLVVRLNAVGRRELRKRGRLRLSLRLTGTDLLGSTARVSQTLGVRLATPKH